MSENTQDQFGQLPTTGPEDPSGWGNFNNLQTFAGDCPFTDGCSLQGSYYVHNGEVCFEQSRAMHIDGNIRTLKELLSAPAELPVLPGMIVIEIVIEDLDDDESLFDLMEPDELAQMRGFRAANGLPDWDSLQSYDDLPDFPDWLLEGIDHDDPLSWLDDFTEPFDEDGDDEFNLDED